MPRMRPMDTCHPDRPHLAHGLCASCDTAKRRKEKVLRTGLTYRQAHASGKMSECHPDRSVEALGLCHACYQAKCRSENIEEYRRADREYSKNMPTIKRRSIRYKISVDEINEIFDGQAGMCAICKVLPATHLDHDHKTGKVRGFLCQKCNAGLGMFLDKTKSLLSAIDYLDRHVN